MNMLYDNRRACEVASKDKPTVKGFFHRWITEAYTIDPVLAGRQPGQVMYTKALVEFEDGTVHMIDPSRIRFTDNK